MQPDALLRPVLSLVALRPDGARDGQRKWESGRGRKRGAREGDRVGEEEKVAFRMRKLALGVPWRLFSFPIEVFATPRA